MDTGKDKMRNDMDPMGFNQASMESKHAYKSEQRFKKMRE